MIDRFDGNIIGFYSMFVARDEMQKDCNVILSFVNMTSFIERYILEKVCKDCFAKVDINIEDTIERFRNEENQIHNRISAATVTMCNHPSSLE